MGQFIHNMEEDVFLLPQIEELDDLAIDEIDELMHEMGARSPRPPLEEVAW